MDVRCPACALEMKRLDRLPRPGERSWLPLRQDLACPHCGVRVERNLHPVEQKLRTLDATLIASAGAAVLGGADMRWFWAALGASGLVEIGLSLWRRHALHGHPGYRLTRKDAT